MKTLSLKQTTLLGAFIYLFAGVLAFAQESVTAVASSIDLTPVAEVDFLGKLLSLIGGYKGMATGALVLAVVQLVIMFLKTDLAGKIFQKLTGQAKLMAVTFFTIVAGYLTLTASGKPVGEAVVATLALPMVQEFLYQVYKQFFVKK